MTVDEQIEVEARDWFHRFFPTQSRIGMGGHPVITVDGYDYLIAISAIPIYTKENN